MHTGHARDIICVYCRKLPGTWGKALLVLAVGRVRSAKYEEIKTRKKRIKPPNPKHTTKSTAARRPRPTRRRSTKHVPRGSPYSHASSIDPRFVEISLPCIHTYPNCCCCAACILCGALFLAGAASAFSTVTPGICVSPVSGVLHIELSARA